MPPVKKVKLARCLALGFESALVDDALTSNLEGAAVPVGGEGGGGASAPAFAALSAAQRHASPISSLTASIA